MYIYSQPKTKNDSPYDVDCMVRCVVHATNIPYRTVYRIMRLHGWSHNGFRSHWKVILKNTLSDFGYTGEVIKLPPSKIKNRKILTCSEFITLYPHGIFITNMYAHVSCVRDGIILDTWDCSKYCVYNAFEIIKLSNF